MYWVCCKKNYFFSCNLTLSDEWNETMKVFLQESQSSHICILIVKQQLLIPNIFALKFVGNALFSRGVPGGGFGPRAQGVSGGGFLDPKIDWFWSKFEF